jgi:Cellulase (glycosyl hydrolase family 5)
VSPTLRAAITTAALIFVGFLFPSLAYANAKSCPPPEEILSRWDLWSHATCLRGANLWQKVVRPDEDGDAFGTQAVGPYYSQKDIDRLAAMGANYVNLSFPGLFTETPPYQVSPEVVAALDELLTKIRAANLFVVLSFRTGPGRNEATFDSAQTNQVLGTVWTDPRAQEAWADQWAYTARRYGNHSHPEIVAFDLMVEPNSNALPLNIEDPKVFYASYGGTLYDFNPMAQHLTQVIREVDRTMPILVQPMNYADIDWLEWMKPLPDPYTVYAIHYYNPNNYSHQVPPLSLIYPGVFDPDGNGKVSVDKSWLSHSLAPALTFLTDHEAPVAVNEFGAMRWEPGASQYDADAMEIFEEEGANHAVWLWETSAPMGYDEFDFRKGPDYSNHKEVATSALMDVLRTYWKRNRVRPSDVRGRW